MLLGRGRDTASVPLWHLGSEDLRAQSSLISQSHNHRLVKLFSSWAVASRSQMPCGKLALNVRLTSLIFPSF